MTKNTMRKRMLGSKIRRVQEVQAHKMRERERERGYLPWKEMIAVLPMKETMEERKLQKKVWSTKRRCKTWRLQKKPWRGNKKKNSDQIRSEQDAETNSDQIRARCREKTATRRRRRRWMNEWIRVCRGSRSKIHRGREGEINPVILCMHLTWLLRTPLDASRFLLSIQRLSELPWWMGFLLLFFLLCTYILFGPTSFDWLIESFY